MSVCHIRDVRTLTHSLALLTYYVLKLRNRETELERFKISPVAFPYNGELNFHVSSSGNLHLTSQYRKHKQENTCEVFLPSFLVSVMIILNAWFIFIHPRTIILSVHVEYG